MTKPLRKNEVSLRAGQNANAMLLIDSCEITPVSEETGRWSRMDSNPFARLNLQGQLRSNSPTSEPVLDTRWVRALVEELVSQTSFRILNP